MCAETKGTLFREPTSYRWCGTLTPQLTNRPVIGGAELSHHSGTKQRALCEQRRRLPYFANRPVIGGAELSHHSTEQQALCEQRRRVPYFANRPFVGGAELSHYSTEHRALCEQRRRIPYFADRTDVGGAELSHQSTDQQEQRARIPHLRASRKGIDRVQGSNQNDCPPVQYSRYPTDVGSTQLEYVHRSEQTEGPEWQGQVEPPVQQPEVSTLVPVYARVSGMGRRAVEKKHTRTQNAWYGSGTFKKTDLDKKASIHKKEQKCCTS